MFMTVGCKTYIWDKVFKNGLNSSIQLSFGHVKIVACYGSYILRVMFIWVYLVTGVKCQQAFRGKYLGWVEDPVTL